MEYSSIIAIDKTGVNFPSKYLKPSNYVPSSVNGQTRLLVGGTKRTPDHHKDVLYNLRNQVYPQP